MIDFGKLQVNIIKNIFYARLKGKKSDYIIYKPLIIGWSEYIPVTHSAVSLFLIPANLYMLSTELQQRIPKEVESFFKDVVAEEWKLTDTGMIMQSRDKQLKIFETKEGKSVFVDVQLLKPFGKDIGLYGNEKADMVYIKGVLNFEGLVCVCKIKEKQ
jgi:hypothetical protein|nr:MAG TPA: hypothetical protein [Caudoviricetes sp.]